MTPEARQSEIISNLMRRSMERELTPKATVAQVTFEKIIEAVCRVTGFSESEIRGPGRKGALTEARALVSYLCRKLTGLTYESIGAFVGRDHTTVLYHVNLVESREHLKVDLRAVKRELRLAA